VGKDTASFYKQFPSAPALPPVPSNLSELFPSLLPEETEDCLFFEVHVPREVFHRERDGDARGAAVWLWIHGGGLILGSKTSDTDFEGLLSRSREGSEGRVIVVSINYRV
jgi:carboxylesterase type B